MADIFRLEMLPALHGDCLLLEYGDAARPHRVLIDGGPIGAWQALAARLDVLPADQRELDLLVITHVDADHIEGCLKLLNHGELATFRDIWFNGWPHVGQQLKEPEGNAYALDTPPPPGQRSPMQGMEISTRIDGRLWNAAFRGAPVFVPARGPLPVRELPGGLRWTLLSPTLPKLEKLRAAYERALTKASIDPEDTEALRARLDAKTALRGSDPSRRPTPSEILSSASLATSPMDNAVANGSSIAAIVEYQGRRLALLGDAHAPTLSESLARLAASLGEPRVRLDAIKLAHHGSVANLDDTLLNRVDCDTWLISTNGNLFNHPDTEAVAAIVKRGRGQRLLFNYRSERTSPWDDSALRETHRYTPIYPKAPDSGLVLDLLSGAAS